MIIFSSHSLLKLEQRNLTKEKVITVVENPDFIEESHGGRKMTFKKLGKLFLKVIYKQEARDIIIISQHWIQKL